MFIHLFSQGSTFSEFYLEKYPNRKKRERRLRKLKFSMPRISYFARWTRETVNWEKSW